MVLSFSCFGSTIGRMCQNTEINRSQSSCSTSSCSLILHSRIYRSLLKSALPHRRTKVERTDLRKTLPSIMFQSSAQRPVVLANECLPTIRLFKQFFRNSVAHFATSRSSRSTHLEFPREIRQVFCLLIIKLMWSGKNLIVSIIKMIRA